MNRVYLRSLILFVVTLTFVASANAQTYGSVTLTPGFGSQSLSGVSGGQTGVPAGQVDASTYGDTATGPCRGWIAAAPDHMMILNAAFTSLAIEVTATGGGDTALVIAGPGGAWCNDDTNGLNPSVVGTFGPGTYSVWVASYSVSQNHAYTITFSDRGNTAERTVVVPPVQGLMTSSLTPTDPMGQLALGTGFMPDPQIRSLNVVGSIDVSAVANRYGGTCRGYVMPNPNHIMSLTTAFSYLRVHVKSTQDTTLLIQDPNGGFWCNDDADGYNPIIEGPWQPGLWRIWVGSYSSGNSATYSIEFTEHAR